VSVTFTFIHVAFHLLECYARRWNYQFNDPIHHNYCLFLEQSFYTSSEQMAQIE